MTFQDLLDELGVRYKQAGEDKHARTGWLQLECPFCGKGSDKFHLGISLKTGACSCWHCGRHSRKETLVALSGLSWKEAEKALAGMDFVRVKEVEKTGTLVMPKGIQDMGPRHRRYLEEQRGLDSFEMEELWGLRGLEIASPPILSWRVFIPITLNGETVSWTTRAISRKAEQRYLSAREDQEAVNHKTLLYGEEKCRHACCVVEGPGDVWALGPGAVGTFGTALTPAQVRRIASFAVVGIALDNEPEAQRTARQLAHDISLLGAEVILIQWSGKDAGSAKRKEIKQVRKTLGL